MKQGILSHKLAAAVAHKSVAMPDMQARRKSVVLPNKMQLHSYANLYINARNKMMSKLRHLHQDLCVLRIDKSVLLYPTTIVADQNASSGYVRFGSGVAGLSRIEKDIVFARDWRHPGDEIAEWRHGSQVCAEVLIWERVPPKFIKGAYVSCKESAVKVRALCPDLDVGVNSDLFFK
jgi:hypothetical protein